MSESTPLYGPVPADRTASGRLAVPGSKSLTQRYFALALVARRRLSIRGPLDSEDIRHFLGALRAAGFGVTWDASGDVHLEPGSSPVGDEPIDVEFGSVPVERRGVGHAPATAASRCFRPSRRTLS